MTDTYSEPNTSDHNMNTNQLTATRIKEERLRLNYTQQAVADHLGMNISNYSRLENGKYEITIAKLEAIAEFFKVPVINFLPTSLQGSINITNGNHSCIGTLINNYTDHEMQNSLKLVVELLQSQIKK
jgi:transcriptional regulator with XRE-family HTH domain